MVICHADNQIYVSQWTQNLKHKILHSKQLVSYIAIVFLGLRCKSRESFDKVTVGTFNINSISSKFDKFKLIVSGLFDVIITNNTLSQWPAWAELLKSPRKKWIFMNLLGWVQGVVFSSGRYGNRSGITSKFKEVNWQVPGCPKNIEVTE